MTAGTRTGDANPATATAPPDGQPAGPPPAAPAGYVLIEELGRGGMGRVYKARQTALNRVVALKVLLGDVVGDRELIRFLAEAEAVAAVRHPHVVQVYDFGQRDGHPYMALELLSVRTLGDRLKESRLQPQDAAALVLKLAQAVAAAHALGIVHRDLKSSNILFDEAGEPKVTDFGLAKRGGRVDLTRTQAVMGTPAYMAPEQARGEAKFVGPQADVWALGVILYECLTGKRPFDADDTWAILQQVIHSSPPLPRAHVPGVPRDLELIALKCLEKNPNDRYPTAAELAEDLERFLAGKPVSVRPAGPGVRFAKWCRRNPAVAALLAALVVVILVGNAGISWGFLRAESRGRELAKANEELNATLADLTRTQELQTKTYQGLKAAQDDLIEQARDLVDARIASDARGYLSDVALAHQLWKANDLAGMRAALERCPPARRKWEWDYLNGLARPEKITYPLDSPPLALAYSPDGRTLAFLTLSGALSAFDVATGKGRLETQLAASGGRARALAFRPDGKELAVACGDRLYLVDTTAWKETEFTPKKKPDDGTAVRPNYAALGYAKDGRLLGAAVKSDPKSGKTTVTIHDVPAETVLAALPAWEQPPGVVAELAGAAFSPDGARFAASAVDSGIRLSADTTPPKFVPFRPVVMVWEVESKKLLGQTEGGGALFGNVAFDPFGRGLGFGRRGSAGILLPEASASLAGNLGGGHTGDVLAVAFDLENRLVWSGGEDKFVRGHDYPTLTGDERFVLRGCTHGILRLAVSPDGKEVAVGAGDITGGGAVHRFDVERLARDVWRSPTGRDRPSLVAALAPDGSRFAAFDFPVNGRTDDGRFVIRDTAGGAERVTKPRGTWASGGFRPDGGLVVCDRHNHLLITDADGKPGDPITFPDDLHHFAPPVTACTPDGKTVAAVGGVNVPPPAGRRPARARLMTWDAATRKPGPSAEVDLTDAMPPGANPPAPHSVTVFTTAAATDRDGKRLAATFLIGGEVPGRNRFEFHGAVVVWELATGRELFRRVTDEPLRAAGFDPFGRVVAAGGLSGGVVFGWDVATGKDVLELRGHTRPILALAFGPDGRLATGGLDRVVKVWDVASRRELITLDGFAREVTHLAFTGDGRDLVAATGIDLTTLTMSGGLPTDWPPAEVRTFRGPR